MSVRNDIKELLDKEGFRYHRMGSKHEIWTDGNIFLTVSVSPSDRRAVDAVRAEIRRRRRMAG